MQLHHNLSNQNRQLDTQTIDGCSIYNILLLIGRLFAKTLA